MTQPRRFPSALRKLTYPAAFVSAPLLTYFLPILTPIHPSLALSLSLLGLGCLILFLERRYPQYSEWRPQGAAVRADLLHTFISTPLPSLLISAVGVGVAQELLEQSHLVSLTQVWPTQWSLLSQVCLALLLSELGAYWIHRTFHLNRFFWRAHALHHTPRGLYTLASARNHPFNVIAIYTARAIPVALFGAKPEVLACLSAINGIHGILQHSNLELEMGPLNHVLAGPELHRRHHSILLEDSRKNFGNILILWDKLFGTFSLPKGENFGPNPGVGVEELEISESYLAHLALPFMLTQWETLSLPDPRALTPLGESDS